MTEDFGKMTESIESKQFHPFFRFFACGFEALMSFAAFFSTVAFPWHFDFPILKDFRQAVTKGMGAKGGKCIVQQQGICKDSKNLKHLKTL